MDDPKTPSTGEHLSSDRRYACAQCGGRRRVDVLGEHQTSELSEGIRHWENWRILRCRGCEYVFCASVTWCSSDGFEADGERDFSVKEHYWPALSKKARPEWFEFLAYVGDGPKQMGGLFELMQEVYGALDAGHNVLAGIGIRTAFDVASGILDIDPELGFRKKLSELVTQRHLRLSDLERIETMIDAGSASAHRGWRPTDREELRTLISVFEHFVNEAFVAPQHRKYMDTKVAAIKAGVPITKLPGKKQALLGHAEKSIQASSPDGRTMKPQG